MQNNEKLVKVFEGNYDKGEIVTNTFIVAENAGISHRSIRDNISKKWKDDLEEFGVLRFENAEVEVGRPETYYLLNEQQATLLFTFMRNSPKVIEFKKRLVKAFFAMRNELLKREETRNVAKIERKAIAESIIESGEQERMHNHGISTYTNLIYKSIFGVGCKKLYEERNIPKNTKNLRDFFSEEELKKIEEKEVFVRQLLELNYKYDNIKNILKVK